MFLPSLLTDVSSTSPLLDTIAGNRFEETEHCVLDNNVVPLVSPTFDVLRFGKAELSDQEDMLKDLIKVEHGPFIATVSPSFFALSNKRQSPKY